MNILKQYKQKGIGVIEVMIAAVIFALGSIAIIQLQGAYFKSSGASHARSLAMNLAEEKLEDLRGFEAINDADGDIFDFVAITANAGGQCDATNDNACALTIPSGTVTTDNTTYTRTWAVTDYYYNAGALTTTPNGDVAQKDITVTITWTDPDGSAQTATANTIINSTSVASGGVLVSNAGGSGENPEVPYTPSIDDRVTPITVGTNSKRETLVPSSETVDGYTRTKFTAYTYNSSNVLLREEEFQNVACTCRFDGTSASGSETYEASYPSWNGTDDTYEDIEGALVTGKVKGCVQGGGSNCDANPEPFCEICCRDHHDKTGAPRKYDPYRSSDDFEASGNHKHYNGTSTAVTSGQYLESCRLKRIDGYWRVFQDWNLINLEALPLTDLANSTVKADYATYVNRIIDAHIDTGSSAFSGGAASGLPTEPTLINHNVSGSYVDMTVGTNQDLSARGLYLDYIDSTHLTSIQAKKSASQDYLLHVPFYEVEVVEVTDWQSADSSIVKVGPYDGPGSANDLDAGEMDALASDTTPIVITANLRKSNSGLTDTSLAIDFNATTNADTVELSDSLTVCTGGTCGTPPADCSHPDGVSADIAHGDSETFALNATEPYGTACSTETRTCTNGTLSGSYAQSSCTVGPAANCSHPDGVSADIVHGTSDTFYLNATENYPATCSDEARICNNGTLSGSYTEASCSVVGAPVGTCTNPADSSTILDGDSVTLWQNATVPFGSTCSSETRTCSSGTLSGAFTEASCSVEPAASCTNPAGGADIAHGASDIFYLNATETDPATCSSESRSCTNGTLSGSYTSASCIVIVPTCTTTVSGKANNKNDSIVLNDGTDHTCSVANSRNFTCPSVTTATNATITVTSAGTVNQTTTITPICGAKTVNF